MRIFFVVVLWCVLLSGIVLSVDGSASLTGDIIRSSHSTTPVFSVSERVCNDGDGDGYGVNCTLGPDCDDSDASIQPGAIEVCNGKDDDCNSIVDDGLVRECGVSSVGVCRMGTESCVAGFWSSCSAILPGEEICGNGLDDNCDGSVDESCGKSDLSKDEIALKQFLDVRFGRDKYEFAKYLSQERDTRDFVNLKKSSIVHDGKTKVSLVFVPIRTLYNFTVFEYIPKTIASSSGDVVFSVEPEVIQSDPLVAWHFAEVAGRLELSYEVDGEFDDASEKTATISFAESSAGLKNPWYFDFLPVLIIIVLGLVFIVLVEAVRSRDNV